MRRLFALLTAVACASCSGISVTRFDGTRESMKGVPYNLPMTSFSVDITRYVAECKPGGLVPAIAVKIKAATVPDPEGRFTLRSSGWFSTSDIKSTYTVDGVSTSLNATSTDQTGTVATNVVSAVASLAPLFFVLAGTHVSVACTEDVNNAVDDVARLTPIVKADSDVLADSTDNLTFISGQVALLGRGTDRKTKDALFKAMEDQRKAKKNLDDHQRQLDDAIKKTSYTETITLPPDGRTFKSGRPSEIDPKVWEHWTGQKITLGGIDPKDLAALAAVAARQKAAEPFNVYWSLERISAQNPAGATTPLRIDTESGIPVRFPVQGQLTLCQGDPCSNGKEVPSFNPYSNLG